ncbi:hypothetical protein EDC94DRAFT_13628 [Helicostylum pulchrum]|nr:hypothetical protein EDC94DRAFT_13628 [Helicostylum pulchrum]
MVNAESLVEVKFQDLSLVDLAISKGITVVDMVFNGVPSKNNMASRPLTRVRMTMLYLPDEQSFIMGLKRVMRTYGGIHWVKKYYLNGFLSMKVKFLCYLIPQLNIYMTMVSFRRLHLLLVIPSWIVPVRYKCADHACGLSFLWRQNN